MLKHLHRLSASNSPTQPALGNTRACHTGNQGFTLVEAMVAILVMGITFASTAVCMQVGLVQHDNARCLNYVTEVLQDQAEDIRLLNWTGIQALPSTATQSIPSSFEIEGIDTSRFTFTRIISDVSGISDIKNINLVGTWTSLKGNEHHRTLIIRYAKSGLYDYYYGVSQ